MSVLIMFGTVTKAAFVHSNCCLGALSEWLADHPVMINNVLPLVLQALGNPELSISSVSTLKKICRECKYDLPPYAANIVAVSQVIDSRGLKSLVLVKTQKVKLVLSCTHRKDCSAEVQSCRNILRGQEHSCGMEIQKDKLPLCVFKSKHF